MAAAARDRFPGSPAPPPTAESEEPAPTVLVVDGDTVSRRFVELALEKEGTFQVEAALDAAGALEILAHTPVHAIVCDTELLDMNGLYLFRRLSTESRLRNLPFLFLSSDSRVATRVVAFEAGVDDFLVKPCDVAELVARIKALIVRQRRAMAASRRRGYMLAGRFSALAFPDLVSIIEQARRTGTLSIVGDRAVGAVYFDEGRIVHAIHGNLVGQRAFQSFMTEEDAQFEFTQEPCSIAPAARSINDSATALILEAARIIDTQTATAIRVPDKLSRPMNAARRAIEHIPGRTVSLAPALAPAAAPAFEHGISDGFALADLRIYSQQELAKWTRAEGGRARFHVHLVADPSEGVSSMLALAGSPSERFVQASLSSEPKALGLGFFLPPPRADTLGPSRERLLDLVLLDVLSPRAFQGSLLRVPSLLILAPPGGDFLAIGTKARVELEQLIAHLGPTAIVGVGNQALEPTLRSLASLRERSRLLCIQGALGFGRAELRSLLVEGIRLVAQDPGKAT